MNEKTVNTIDKIVETINYLTVPVAGLVAGVAAIWGYSIDIAVYTAAFAGMVNSIWKFVKLFNK